MQMKRFLKNNLIIIGLCLGFISCSSEQKYVETENLQGELMVTDSLNAGANPSILADSVWLLSSFSNKFNTNVSVQKGDSLKTKTLAFMRGAGHGEYDKTAFAVSSDKSLYVLNCSSNGNKIYSLSRVAQAKWLNGNYKIDESYDLTKLPALRYIPGNYIMLSDSTFLICGAPYSQIEHIFTVVNFKKSTLTPLNYWPKDKNQKGGLAKHSVYTDNASIFRNKDKFLYLCGWERYAFLFKIDEGNVEVEKELYSEKLDYKEIADGNYAPTKISGKSLRMDANQKAIYFFLIEKNKEGQEPKNYMESQFGNEVEVYDWDGKLLRHIILDKVGYNIKVSDDNKCLYLFTMNTKSNAHEIWQYQL